MLWWGQGEPLDSRSMTKFNEFASWSYGYIKLKWMQQWLSSVVLALGLNPLLPYNNFSLGQTLKFFKPQFLFMPFFLLNLYQRDKKTPAWEGWHEVVWDTWDTSKQLAKGRCWGSVSVGLVLIPGCEFLQCQHWLSGPQRNSEVLTPRRQQVERTGIARSPDQKEPVSIACCSWGWARQAGESWKAACMEHLTRIIWTFLSVLHRLIQWTWPSRDSVSLNEKCSGSLHDRLNLQPPPPSVEK